MIERSLEKTQERRLQIRTETSNRRVITFILVAMIATLTTSCGGEAYKTATSSPSSSNPNPGSNIIPWITNPGNSNTTATTLSGTPAISESFTIQGTRGPGPSNYSPAHPTSSTFSNINADSRLVFDLSANNTVTIQGAGSVLYSSCMQITLQILDHATGNQIGSNITLSANTSSSSGSGACVGSASGTATPAFDASSYLTSGSGAVDVVISQAQSAVTSNSSSFYWPSTSLELLYYTYAQAGTLTIHTDTTQ